MSGVERAIDSIIIGARIRKDPGDLNPLKASISTFGLLHPIAITPDGVLLCGYRRLTAVRELGHRTIAVHVIAGVSPDLGRLMAERDENLLRKDFTIGELTDLYVEMKAILADDAHANQARTRFGHSGVTTVVTPVGDVRANAAIAITGRRTDLTFERILEMRAVAADETYPVELRELAAAQLVEADASGRVAKPHAETIRAKQTHALRASLSRGDLDPTVRAALEGRLAALESARTPNEIRQRVHDAGRATPGRVLYAPLALADFLERSTDIRHRFDPVAVAAEFTGDRLAVLDRFVDEWVTFRDEVHRARAS